jgi:hypothetical protein
LQLVTAGAAQATRSATPHIEISAAASGRMETGNGLGEDDMRASRVSVAAP